jgi:hypothetical protein
MSEERSGFAFNNPDLKNDYHAPKWGLLVTADELRYDQAFGNKLIAAADSQDITDDQLLDYVRLALGYVERELKLDILPRRIRYMNRIGSDGKEILRDDIDEDKKILSQYKTRKQKNALYIREQGYPYRLKQVRKEMRIKLRRRPVRDILTAELVDPYRGLLIADLLPYRVLKPGLTGVCYFRQNTYLGRGYAFSNAVQSFSAFQADNIQSLFLIDYDSGYESCEDVPDDLRWLIGKIAAVTLLSIYGLGKSAGMASRSVSLNAVSESISTTQSATSSYFGANILQYQKEIREWFKDNSKHYARTSIGCL